MYAALDNCPTLVLNADFRPLNYFPLSLWGWQEAVKAVFLGRVNVVSEMMKPSTRRAWQCRCPASYR